MESNTDYVETDGRPGFRRMISDLAGDLRTLVRQEFNLARAELSEKASEAKSGAVSLGVGGAILHAGALVLAAMIVLGFALVLRTWMDTLSALFVSSILVGGILAVVGYAMVKGGARHLSPNHFVPRKTVHSIQQDLKLARGRYS